MHQIDTGRQQSSREKSFRCTRLVVESAVLTEPRGVQAKVIVAPRSNNLLDTTRMEKEFPELLGIKESLIKYVFEPNALTKDKVKASVDEMRESYRKPAAA